MENQRKLIGRVGFYIGGIAINFGFWYVILPKVWSIIYDSNTSITLNRLGLILQILSMAAVIPNLARKDKVQDWQKSFSNITEQMKNILAGAKKIHQEVSVDFMFQDGPIKKINDVAKILALFIMLYTGSIMLMLPYEDPIDYYSGALCAITLFVAPVLLWISVGRITSISKVPPPKPIADLYDGINIAITLFAMLISIGFILFIALYFMPIRWLAKQPIELALALVTAPLLTVGTFLQLISTYYR
jgi:hypothetical protein